MTLTTTSAATPAASSFLPRILPLLVAAVLYLVVLMGGANLLNDPDSYWHVMVGQWIVEHRAFPRTDPFSFTFAGAPWIAKEWLSQLLYAGAKAFAGWTGMVVLAAASVGLAFAIFTRSLVRNLAPIPTLVFAAAAFLLTAPHILARPHMLALPVMVAWVAGLVRAADDRRAPSLWLLPLMVLWANLHAAFTFGILMVAALGLDAIAGAAKERRVAVAAEWIGFGILAVIAGCITPYGPESLFSTVRILGLGSDALALIGEWRAADFSRVGAFEVVLLVAIGLALWRGFRPSLVRILILVGLLHMALSSERNAEFFALVAPLVVARALARQFPSLAADSNAAAQPALVPSLILAIFVVAATAFFAATASYAPDRRITPAAALAVIEKAKPGRVFNAYDFGGYLVSAGVPTFIDGRGELYGADFMLRQNRAVTLADIGELEKLLDDYRIGATLLQPGAPAVQYLDRSADWQRLYADDIAVVHVRRGGVLRGTSGG
jgi:hypothetical protein